MDNPYLLGNFTPVTDELTVLDLPVEGALPPELTGRLLRNGPNPIAPDPAAYHWFTGDGMVHAIELRDGRAVSYRNRWVRTDAAAAKLGEAPLPDQPDDVFPMGNTANTHVVAHAGRILSLLEVCLPTELTPELATVGRFDYRGKLRSAMTAHPKLDPVTGELLFIGYDPFGPPYLRFHVADTAGELGRSEDIGMAGPAMVHDFAITERYVVFLDLPVVLDIALADRRAIPYRWMPEYGARVGVMARSGGAVRWFDVEPCYVFHTVNAYEADDQTIVLDVIRHPTMFVDDVPGPAEQTPTLDRWTIDLAVGTVREQRLDDRSQELPRIDERRLGRAHRYGYTSESPVRPGAVNFGGLLKHDLSTGASQTAGLRPGEAAGEPVFVPGGDGEDDGWVLSVVYDATRDGSDLVVLDASDFGAPPVARVALPQRVPFGFHGSWIPAGAV